MPDDARADPERIAADLRAACAWLGSAEAQLLKEAADLLSTQASRLAQLERERAQPSPLLIHAIRAEAVRAQNCGAVITADLLTQEADDLEAAHVPVRTGSQQK